MLDLKLYLPVLDLAFTATINFYSEGATFPLIPDTNRK